MSTHLSIHPSISWVWYLGRNVDRQYVLNSTPVGVLNLVGVSAEFGTKGGMLIGYSHYVQHRFVHLVWQVCRACWLSLVPWEECWSVTVIKFNIVWGGEGVGGGGGVAKFDTLEECWSAIVLKFNIGRCV